MTTYLSPRQVMFIHARLISETGGEHDVRDVGLLESAVARPRATFDGRELHPDVFSKAAALMESLVLNHPFIDGNERTAIAAAALFLLRNGYQVKTDDTELERFAWSIAGERPGIDEIAAWYRANTVAFL